MIRITPTVLQEAYSQGGGGEGGEREGVKEDFRGIVVPGEVIFASGANLITGHGTYRVDDSGRVAEAIAVEQPTLNDDPTTTSALPMHASMAGRLKSVNKLVYVEPPNTRYSGNVGDTVVGRIVEVICSKCFLHTLCLNAFAHVRAFICRWNRNAGRWMSTPTTWPISPLLTSSCPPASCAENRRMMNALCAPSCG